MLRYPFFTQKIGQNRRPDRFQLINDVAALYA